MAFLCLAESRETIVHPMQPALTRKCWCSIVRRLTQQQRLLLFGDASQLGHIGLEKSNAERQVDAHDPELGTAQEMAIRGVCQQDLDQIDVQEECASDGNLQVADPDKR